MALSPCAARAGRALGLVMASGGGVLISAVAFVQAFAGGPLADTMMPEAFRYGGTQVDLIMTIGFALAFFITTLERGETW